MKKTALLLSLSLFFASASASFGADQVDFVTECKENIAQNFPKTKIVNIKQSPLAGVCEVHTGINVLYYQPQEDGSGLMIVGGGIYNSNGVNLTQQAKDDLVSQVVQDLPLENSISYGTGPVDVVLFTDPDCHFCRTFEQELQNIPDLENKATVNVFLYSSRPVAKTKIKWIFCQENPKEAIGKVMLEKILDEGSIQFPPDCRVGDIENRMNASQSSASAIALKRTPTLIVDGSVVKGKPNELAQSIIKAYQAKTQISLN